MRIGIVVFPGSNCDHDAVHAVEDVFHHTAVPLWHKDADLKGVDGVIVPGGFSYGDYLRCGAMAALAPVMREVKAFAARGGPVLGIFSTGPEIRHTVQNLLTEIIATIVLVLFILTMGMTSGVALSGIGVLLVALLVVGIGLSLGGPTGYAINPVRDLGPRIVHALLPLPNKGGSDWGYAWIPVVGPLIGGAIAGGIYQLAFA